MSHDSNDSAIAYWREHLRLLTVCLVIWFSVSFLLGILFVGQVNRVTLGGYPLGLWFAMQGSIFTFVVLIFFYTWKMSKIDKKYDVEEE